MNKIDDIVCINCLDVILGINKTKDAEYYRINNKQYCGLICYYEDYNKSKNETPKIQNGSQAHQSHKRQKQVFKKRSQSKKSKRK